MKNLKTIINEKKKYEQMKESIGTMRNRNELSENSRDIRENNGNAKA